MDKFDEWSECTMELDKLSEVDDNTRPDTPTATAISSQSQTKVKISGTLTPSEKFILEKNLPENYYDGNDMDLEKRLQWELLNVRNELESGSFKYLHLVEVEHTYKKWILRMSGGEGTPYETGEWPLTLTFEANHSRGFTTVVRFVTDMYHPNVYPNGVVCMDNHIQISYSHTHTIWSLLLSIHFLLGEPSPDVAANIDAARLYLLDINKFKARVARSIADPEDSAAYSTALCALEVEYNKYLKEKPTGITIADNTEEEDPLEWHGVIVGLKDTRVAFRKFPFLLKFTKNFPFHPPELRLMIDVFHPDISSQGIFELEVLQENWSPCNSLTAVLVHAQMALGEPQVSSGVNHRAIAFLRANVEEYWIVANKVMDGEPSANFYTPRYT